DLATLDVRPFYFGQYELFGSTMGSPQDFTGLLKLLDAKAVKKNAWIIALGSTRGGNKFAERSSIDQGPRCSP
ncbi:hypothetical protein QNA19_24635, partial [Rhodococcus fascians]|nr:hypothetical protein [Rhodococcus fascians]